MLNPCKPLICSTSTGVVHIDFVVLLIDVLRKVSAAHRFVRPVHGNFPLGSKVWDNFMSGHKLRREQSWALGVDSDTQAVTVWTESKCGRKVGIVGLGSVGLKVAKRLEAFGCIISYLSRKKKPVSYPFYCDVHELAAKCDVLVICCALIDQTRHLINKEVLLALGKGLLINIARGTIINEIELVQCLDQGEIAGAGLDVFENEPNVPEELFSLDNVVLSRHVTFYTEDSFKDLYELISGNVEALFLNKPLLSPVLDD
ncbi:hypothetical protein RND71_007328 [Anisodus tanguticus]|uniref:D-isomer specific 2-hydroxyacid dehydrogenase NAD-binding domain-containing protein n=1 Tax=Anisodus tanguticus TaxID=243964 RepID=A0AAE1SLL3_9SOLA|nr:hypothetical protein RND71_007328 [Anisodus tanguticus]